MALRTGTTYFLQPADGTIVKIGGTKGDPRSRPQSQSFSGGRELHLVGVVYLPEETIQSQFRQFHVRGDWFRPELPLIDFIRHNAEKTEEERKRFREINLRKRRPGERMDWQEEIAIEWDLESVRKDNFYGELEGRVYDECQSEECRRVATYRLNLVPGWSECDLELWEEECECDNCEVEITLMDIGELRILESVFVSFERQCLLLEIGPLSSGIRQRELDWLTGSAFWSLDAICWTLQIVSTERDFEFFPYVETERLPKSGVALHFISAPHWQRHLKE